MNATWCARLLRVLSWCYLPFLFLLCLGMVGIITLLVLAFKHLNVLVLPLVFFFALPLLQVVWSFRALLWRLPEPGEGEIRLPDGRYLIYYTFDDEAPPPPPKPAPPKADV